MLISVHRNKYTSQSTGGILALDGIFECYTLEPRADESQGKPYCVPAGRYGYMLYNSPRLGRKVILVGSVPGFVAVEVHPGNFPIDTHGCCLVGKTFGIDFVGQSDAEFDLLMAKIPATGEIEYVDS